MTAQGENPAAALWPEGYTLIELVEVDSTNAEAGRRACAGEKGPLWIAAARQTAGRGRRGNAWQSLEGNLSATLLVRPGKSAGECAQLSFAASLAASDMLARFAPTADIKVKWPNDVLADGRKIAGILLEAESGGVPGWLAVGIGVNLAVHPARAGIGATSLAAQGAKPPTPKDALVRLAAAFAKWYDRWQKEGFAVLREAWLARASMLGAHIVVRLPQGETVGIFRGISENGALMLEPAGGAIREISAGEVFFQEV